MRRPFLPRRVYIVSRAHFTLAVFLFHPPPLSVLRYLVVDIVAVVLRRARRHARLCRAQTRVILKLFYLKFYNPHEPNVSADPPPPPRARAAFAVSVSICNIALLRRDT